MRISLLLLAVTASVSPAARAISVDAKALARFDISYVKCESQFPDMRGQRDTAYLSLWRVKMDDKARAQLAAARKGAAYQSERRRLLQSGAAGAAAAASSPIEQQCQALRAETQRAAKPKN
jgi:hypothetical protein